MSDRGSVRNAVGSMMHLEMVRTEAAVRRILGAPDGPMTPEEAEAYRAAASGCDIVRIRSNYTATDRTEIRTVSGRVLWRGEWAYVGGAYSWREEWLGTPHPRG